MEIMIKIGNKGYVKTIETSDNASNGIIVTNIVFSDKNNAARFSSLGAVGEIEKLLSSMRFNDIERDSISIELI